MKTVTGKITDSTPVSISKAASILSKFVSSENGASQALNAYLRRATAAFDELSRLHSKSDRRKHKKDSSLIRSVEASQSELVNNSEQMLKKEVKEEGLQQRHWFGNMGRNQGLNHERGLPGVSHYTSKNRPSKLGLPRRREHLSAEPRHVDSSWDQAWWIRFRLMAKTVSWPVNHSNQPSVFPKKPSIEHGVIAIILF
ncbi:hypothetical protein D5086_033703 [Populus alba]|uniref:Uncharacterized protein n=1 Tax=Populus alba TaxID=43335 RepID=A0ACC4AIF5_POPAL